MFNYPQNIQCILILININIICKYYQFDHVDELWSLVDYRVE